MTSITSITRDLQLSSNFTQTRSDDEITDERDVIQFVGFLAWYCFLVLCCIVPPCIAYRRRRLFELRNARQAYLHHQIAANGIVFLGGADYDDPQTELLSPEQRLQLAVMLKESLRATTMTVAEGDATPILEDNDNIVDSEVAQVASAAEEGAPPDEGAPDDKQGPAPEAPDEEMQASATATTAIENSSLLQLPNGSKVSGACAICLTPYEVDDDVAYSPNHPDCVHAFHSECIISWLQKKPTELNCPCCRQPFCTIAGDDDDDDFDVVTMIPTEEEEEVREGVSERMPIDAQEL